MKTGNIRNIGTLVAFGATFAAPAFADQVFSDDVIVTGSLCVGFDCVNGESFGFDTIRLKENNLRLHFQDTSNSGSFPSNDWRIVANDTSNGGANYLAFEDSTAGRNPFRVDAGAPANSLYVKDSGNVGLGTSTPAVEMHIVDGDSPAIRLEQNGSSGFTPQTYDIAANETNFFIRDVTNGSKLFFRAKPGAPESSLFIAADGDIGLGKEPDNFVDLDIQNAGDVIIELSNSTSGVNWQLKNQADEFRITTPPGGLSEQELVLDADGNLAISGLLRISNSSATPAAISFQSQLFVDSADGDLKVIFGNGTIKTIATND